MWLLVTLLMVHAPMNVGRVALPRPPVVGKMCKARINWLYVTRYEQRALIRAGLGKGAGR
jgi:hypothetical protein